MPVVSHEKLVALQSSPEGIRNICILAHVDHGKTSLADVLIASNGIISPKLAGKVRYLDSRPDEQLRGITMESSAISLSFQLIKRGSADKPAEQKDYLINLIDSPGHVDFSSEVSTASRLCDGAIVLVDAVEGVCSQTVTVLRQVWMEKLKAVLIVNKVDRLVKELKMRPAEAYSHLTRLVEQVNAVMGSFYQGERMEEDLKWRENLEKKLAAVSGDAEARTKASSTNGDISEPISQPDSEPADDSLQFEEKDDEDIYFAPAKDNVVFSSATDGWAFTVKQFASLYEKKLGLRSELLQRVLWGDYYLEPKKKRVIASKHLKGRPLKPMFVQFILDNIWAVYHATLGDDTGKGDTAMVEKIVKSLSLTIPNHVLRSRDPRTLMTTLFAAWLPLSTAVLVSIVEHLPPPPVAQAARMPAIIEASPGSEAVAPEIYKALSNFTASQQAPRVAFVSKMVAIRQSELPQNKRQTGATLTPDEVRELARRKRAEFAQAQAHALEDSNSSETRYALAKGGLETDEEEDPEHLLGFARLYSGTLTVGDEVYVLNPKFSPAQGRSENEPKRAKIKSLYLLMGRSLEPLESVPAGVVFAIGGLENHIFKAGTLCSQIEGAVNLAGVNLGSKPIVRVAVEPVNPADLSKMRDGLKMLEQSDPCFEYDILDSGEHVIHTAGELHLERCLKDLRERFAKCEIQAGEPIVPYREAIVSVPEMNLPKSKDLPRGTVVFSTSSKRLSIRLRVKPLPASVTDVLMRNQSTIKQLSGDRKLPSDSAKPLDDKTIDKPDDNSNATILNDMGNQGSDGVLSSSNFEEELTAAFAASTEADDWPKVVEYIIAFGPRRTGPNILVDHTGKVSSRKFFEKSHTRQRTNGEEGNVRHNEVSANLDLADKIVHAFQLATGQGPLCAEPLHGVGIAIESVTFPDTTDGSDGAADSAGRLTGEIIKNVKESISQGFLDWSPRILLAMYSCEIQASLEVLGRVTGVITRRRGRILSDEMREGTPFFTVVAVLPVAESFGFSDEIRKRTSGAASPQLIFQGYEMLDQDPFWVPSTEEDLEDLGELADRENVAKRYMDAVRRRKGLLVAGHKLVVNAEKQKTLKR